MKFLNPPSRIRNREMFTSVFVLTQVDRASQKQPYPFESFSISAAYKKTAHFISLCYLLYANEPRLSKKLAIHAARHLKKRILKLYERTGNAMDFFFYFKRIER